jgi:hypothetical protein
MAALSLQRGSNGHAIDTQKFSESLAKKTQWTSVQSKQAGFDFRRCATHQAAASAIQ